MPELQLGERIIEVLSQTAQGWNVGSGLIVRDSVAITAAHVIIGHEALIVRRRGQDELSAVAYVLPSGRPAVDESADLALLRIIEPTIRRPGFDFARLRLDAELGAVVPGNVRECWGVGFPRFMEKKRHSRSRPVRDSRRVDGYLPVGEGIAEGLATLRVLDPPVEIPSGPIADSPWQGMSGTAVFVESLVAGVVSEHHRPAGINSLTVVPADWIDRCPEARDWWAAVGVADPEALAVFPQRSVSPEEEQRKRILIVEDQIGPTLRHLLAGYDCELVTSLEMWWQLVDDGDLDFDGALVDLHLTDSMDDEQGCAVLEYLRDKTSIPTLLMSVNPAGWSPDFERKYGVTGVYYKGRGGRLSGIRDAVAEMIRRGQNVRTAQPEVSPGNARRRDPQNHLR